jgi:hypothetical protein
VELPRNTGWIGLRRRTPGQRRERSHLSLCCLSPSAKFHLVNRWTFPEKGNPAEIGAIYQDAEARHLAQISIHFGPHDGLICYLARGIPLRRQFLQSLAAADSIADFNIAFLIDESLAGAGQATLLMATTTCTAGGCSESSMPRTGGLRLIWPPFTRENGQFLEQAAVPLSVTLQSREYQADGCDEKHALQQLRELLSNFRLLPLRDVYAPN